jgi:uncharacterized DUF497 family protein
MLVKNNKELRYHGLRVNKIDMVVLSAMFMFREEDRSSTGRNEDVKHARGGGCVTRVGSLTIRGNLSMLGVGSSIAT